MSQFIEPAGINFSSSEKLSAAELSKILREILNFIQKLDSYNKFERYDDWWEHDGLHFYRNSIGLSDLLRIVSSPSSLSEAMPGDWCVFIGIAPVNTSWYLRFYLDDDSQEDSVARFDVTFPNEIAVRFKLEVLSQFNLKIKEQAAETYYKSIIL